MLLKRQVLFNALTLGGVLFAFKHSSKKFEIFRYFKTLNCTIWKTTMDHYGDTCEQDTYCGLLT
jgi:hypothetical protein